MQIHGRHNYFFFLLWRLILSQSPFFRKFPVVPHNHLTTFASFRDSMLKFALFPLYHFTKCISLGTICWNSQYFWWNYVDVRNFGSYSLHCNSLWYIFLKTIFLLAREKQVFELHFDFLVQNKISHVYIFYYVLLYVLK